MADEPVVTYTVSEMFKKIDDRLARLFDKLDDKADKSHVEALTIKVEGHDQDIRSLKDAEVRRAQARNARQNYRQWLIPTLLSGVLVLVTAFTIWHPFG